MHNERIHKIISEKVKSQIPELKKQFLKHKDREYGRFQNQEEDLIQWREELIELYAKTIQLDRQEAIQLVINWGKKVSDFLVNIQMPLDEAIDEIRYYRDQIGQIICESATHEEISYREFYQLISAFDFSVDHAIQIVCITYMENNLKKMQKAQMEIEELTVPIIRLSSKIGVIPLIGELDSDRALKLMEEALKQSSKNGFTHLIIDLSGVPVVDTAVASQIYKVLEGLKLVGVIPKLSGVRPEIAHTMVNLGINFKDNPSYSDLSLALEKIGFIHK
ncbi:STAS domain-containing protein [Bacillus sp. SJS]|uniref:STAS domain-containing protein n=1 Tax=Bacillus sp. SJS TaxID=1423321 RepID=UPI0004DD2D25|nr:STAS domain-containing protein [Bacillus sp. SJS]KZZ84337.1 hypothetical protein AS29_010765 [Bacillus sp. SJS]